MIFITIFLKKLSNQIPVYSIQLLIKPNTVYYNQLLIKQKRKIKKAFIKIRNPFLKSILNAISKKIEKLIKSHRATDIQNRIQTLQLNNDPKGWRTLKKEMGYPNKGSSYRDLKNDRSIVKTDRDKLKQFAEQLKSVFAKSEIFLS